MLATEVHLLESSRSVGFIHRQTLRSPLTNVVCDASPLLTKAWAAGQTGNMVGGKRTVVTDFKIVAFVVGRVSETRRKQCQISPSAI